MTQESIISSLARLHEKVDRFSKVLGGTVDDPQAYYHPRPVDFPTPALYYVLVEDKDSPTQWRSQTVTRDEFLTACQYLAGAVVELYSDNRWSTSGGQLKEIYLSSPAIYGNAYSDHVKAVEAARLKQGPDTHQPFPQPATQVTITFLNSATKDAPEDREAFIVDLQQATTEEKDTDSDLFPEPTNQDYTQDIHDLYGSMTEPRTASSDDSDEDDQDEGSDTPR